MAPAPTTPREAAAPRPVEAAAPARVRPDTAGGPTRVAAGEGAADLGHRRTLGWSGTPTKTPGAGESHLAVIERGLELAGRIHPDLRARLDTLLPRIEDPLPTQRARLEEVTTEIQHLYADPQASRLRALPRDLVERHMGAAAAARQDAMLPRLTALEAEAARLHEQISTERSRLETQALDEMSTLRERILSRGRGGADTKAGRVTIEPSAVQALEARGRTAAAAQRDLAEFYRLTGSKGPAPESLTVMATRGRGEAVPGRVDIGKEASKGLIFHEMAHHIEFRNPALGRASTEFVEARARHAGHPGEQVPLQDLVPKGGYAPHERAMIGDFVDPYVGKVYPDRAVSEVITTGMERFTSPQRMLDLYRSDPEHFFYVLGAIL